MPGLFNGFPRAKPDTTSAPTNDTNDYPNYVINAVTGQLFGAGTNVLVNVTGKRGYFTRCLVSNAGPSNAAGLRITVDGTVIFFSGGHTSSTRLTGIAYILNYIFSSGTLPIRQPGTPASLEGVPSNITYLPFTAGTNAFVSIYEPIFFQKSLLIELINTGGSNTCSVEYQYATT